MMPSRRRWKAKSGLPERADILAALKAVKFQGVAYAAPEAFDAKGDDIAAVIFVNDGATSTAFREIDRDRRRAVALRLGSGLAITT